MEDVDYRTFLEMAGRGCISGNIIEWPQLKPACKWAIKKIKELEEKLKENKGASS